MAERIALNAVTRADRQVTVDAVGNAISAANGWLDDVHFYSNIAAVLRCWVPAGKAAELIDHLSRIGLKFDTAAPAEAAEIAVSVDPATELLVSIQITFVHDDPDLRRHIPSVPG